MQLSGAGGISSSPITLEGSGSFDISQLPYNSTTTITDLSGTSFSSEVILGFNTLTLGTSNNTSFAGVISDASGYYAGQIIKEGAGTLTLLGVNVYIGVTTINDGTIALSGSGSISNSQLYFPSAGTFDISGLTNGGTSIPDLIGYGSPTINLGANTLTIGTPSSPSAIFFGLIVGTGGGIEVTGTGKLSLYGTNTYTGTTTIGDGATLQLWNAGFISSSPITLQGAGIFDISNLTNGGTTITDLSGTSATSTITLGSNTLTLGTSNNTTYAGGISDAGAGAITKEGSGMLVLSGTSTYIGPTTVNGGFLAINGSILSSVTVNSGSTLKGSGTIGAPITVNNGGVISPGNSIGTLTGSSVSFGPSSIFDVEINLSGSGSQLILTGTAGIDPSAIVQVRQDPGVYPSEMSYDILSAAGGITGSFDPTVTVIGGQPGYNFSLLQTLNLIKLQYSYLPPPPPPPPPSGISLIGLQGNRAKLATYLNEYASSDTLEYFTGLSGSSLNSALTSVSPSRNRIPISVMQQTAFTLSGIVSSHLDTFRVAGRNFSKKTSSKKTAYDEQGDSSTIFTEIGKMFDLLVDASDQVLPTPYTKEVSLYKENDFSGWISGLAQYAHQKAEQQNPSYNFLSEVLTTGFDYRGIEKTLLGGGLGYAHTNYSEDQKVGHGNINYYFSTLYANAYIDQFYLSPALFGVYNQVHNTRNISFTGFSDKAKATINSWQFTPHLEVGYDIQEDRWGNITPFTSLDWVINWQAAYNEEGASPFTARQGGRRTSMARSETGFKFSQAWRYSWGALLLKEKGSYIFEKPFATSNLHTGFVGLASALTVITGTSPLNLGSIGFDLQASVGEKKPISIKMGFEGEMGVRYLSGEVNLMLSRDF